MICRVCGLQLGESVKGMEAHTKRYHGVTVAPRPKYPPKDVTVAKWEADHPEFFVGLQPECLDDCKCKSCFQKALDRLVAKSEAQANDIGNDFSQHNELASDIVPERPRANGQYTIQHGYWSENE